MPQPTRPSHRSFFQWWTAVPRYTYTHTHANKKKNIRQTRTHTHARTHIPRTSLTNRRPPCRAASASPSPEHCRRKATHPRSGGRRRRRQRWTRRQSHRRHRRPRSWTQTRFLHVSGACLILARRSLPQLPPPPSSLLFQDLSTIPNSGEGVRARQHADQETSVPPEKRAD